ncbi:RNase-H domain containing protein [Pyrenophora tritici-repentis]|nr:RNase-H domain containing protein [Pyrenophora tritici-repentis]
MGKKSRGVGVGLAIYTHHDQESDQAISRNAGTQVLVYNGELKALAQAFEAVPNLKTSPQEVNIFPDCQAAIHRISNPSGRPGQECQLRAFQAASGAREKGIAISLHWIPSHTSKTPGNNRADELAKKGLMLRPEEGHTSWVFWRSSARKAGHLEWELHAREKETLYMKTSGWKARKKLDIPVETLRRTASAFYQLKLGHGFYKSYLNRFKITQNPRCQCGYSTQDAKHLHIHCPLYREERRRVRREMEGQLSLRVLLGTKKGIRLTIQFLQNTGISTKNWHQAPSHSIKQG